jgi:hypothetical protein
MSCLRMWLDTRELRPASCRLPYDGRIGFEISFSNEDEASAFQEFGWPSLQFRHLDVDKLLSRSPSGNSGVAGAPMPAQRTDSPSASGAGPRHRDRRLRVIDRPSRLFSVRARARESSRVMAKLIGGRRVGSDPAR